MICSTWYQKKKLLPIPNLKMFQERNDSFYVVLEKKASTNP
jgi:hypothetical protein